MHERGVLKTVDGFARLPGRHEVDETHIFGEQAFQPATWLAEAPAIDHASRRRRH